MCYTAQLTVQGGGAGWVDLQERQSLHLSMLHETQEERASPNLSEI